MGNWFLGLRLERAWDSSIGHRDRLGFKLGFPRVLWCWAYDERTTVGVRNDFNRIGGVVWVQQW